MTNYNNKDLAHAWAWSTEGQSGKNSGDTFWFLGASLHSYRTEIARHGITKAGDKYALFNTTSYSITTSQQQRLARNAWGYASLVGAWKNASRGFRITKTSIIESYEQEITDSIEELAQSKRQSRKDKAINHINNVKIELQKLLEFDVLKKSDLTKILKDFLKLELSEESIAKMKAKQEKIEKREAKAALNKAKEQLEEWRKGERDSVRNAKEAFGTDFLKLKSIGDELMIATSQGINVKLREGLKLYNLCKVAKGQGRDFIPQDGSSKFCVGYYTVDRITKGDAKVGCHFFKFEEIQRCFEKEYLPTIKQ